MTQGLSVSRVVNVNATLAPVAAGNRSFGVVAILGDSDVIDTAERLRPYATLDEVAEQFGTAAPEFLAAELHFSQFPRPNILYIGRWARTASKGVLHGGALSTLEADVGSWNAITAGSMAITVDGTVRTLSALNFSGATNLNAVAAIIDTALAGATVVWDDVFNRFDVKSDTTGTASTLSYATPTGSGTDISAKLKLTSALASAPVAGKAPETPLVAVQDAADHTSEWYAIHFAASIQPTDNQLLDVAAYIEGSSFTRVFGHTITGTTIRDPLVLNDLSSRLQAAQYMRSITQHSTDNPYACVSILARAATIQFDAENTMLTLKFKQEPGVAPEVLTETAAQALAAKNCNVYAAYANGTAIFQESKMASGYFFDEVIGIDWMVNRVQNAVWNLLRASPTKIPQTDPGMTQIATTIAHSMQQGVRNGLLAPGQWNGPPFGRLSTGDALTAGFYVHIAPVATQDQADRENRRAVPAQVAAKFAGAVHSADVVMWFNR
jgi:hypothetical protein